MDKKPMVGVGIFIFKEGKVLFGKRKSKHGEGMWSPPGGHLEFGETLEDCAKRETLEEAGITIKNIRPGPYTNDIHLKEDKHYLTVFLTADYEDGKVTVMEPEKCERWEWFTWDALPKPLFLPIENLRKEQYNPLQ